MFEITKKDRSDTGRNISSVADQRDDQEDTFTEDIVLSTEPVRNDVAVIGRSIRIKGDLYGDEDVRIEGDVTGTIKLKKNTLTIGREGKIHADVYAKSVTVDGLMEGDLYGSERVSIRKSAQVRGNITAPRVSLEDGARFKGSIEMDPKAAAAALGDGDGTETKQPAVNPTAIPAKPKRVAATGTNGGKPGEKPESAAEKSSTESPGSAA